MTSLQSLSLGSRRLFSALQNQLDGDDWRLTSILVRLLGYEAFWDSHASSDDGRFRWLSVLNRLIELDSPSYRKVTALLSQIRSIAEKERLPLSMRLPDEQAKILIHSQILTALAHIGNPQDASCFAQRHNSGHRSFHHDLLALRSYLGDADYLFLTGHMRTTKEETTFSWWENPKLWLRRLGSELPK